MSATAQEPRAPEGEPVVCTLGVEGMDCASCAETVSRALRALGGVRDVRVDVVGGTARVEYAAETVGRAELEAAVRRAGYGVRDAARDRRAAARPAGAGWERRERLALAMASGLLWAASLAAGGPGGREGLSAALAAGSVVAGGWYIVPRGVRAARSGALDMNFLMSLAAAGALLVGEHGEAATAMFLFAVAQLLEARSMERARDAIRALMDLSPAEATVLREGREARVPVESVAVGETVVVRPGGKIPVDGAVLRGRSSVDQAPITGESVPVEKEPGAEVFAGTLNQEGALEIRSSRAPADTTLARIIQSVEAAQASRAPSQSFVDAFARVYTPAVVAVAAGTAVLPPLLGLGGWGEWFYRALVLLVVACPCALVISTPVTIVSALTGAARRGILVKGGLHLENAGRVRVVALDKTGTLTTGHPAVVEVFPLDGADERAVLALAAAAEARSEHPVARAIRRAAAERGLACEPAAETTAVPGLGVRARVGGETVYVGGDRMFPVAGALDARLRARLDAQEAAGRTTILVGAAADGGAPALRGLIAVADRVRPGAAAALRDLRRAGVRRVVMLTGDNAGTARAVAAELARSGAAVDGVHARLLPGEKVAAVCELRREHGTIAMVGDGVNDAPALAAADVGIAMGSAGTDVALETADVALMGDDLERLATTIRMARKAERIVRANLWFSLATKAVFAVLAVLGLATLWMAVLADMGASLLVVLNGLRALRE